MRAFILMFFVSLFLVACTPEKPENSSREQSGISYSEELRNTSSRIKDTPEFEECMQPSVKMCITQVGNKLARSEKSLEFCEEMPDIENQDACKYGVVMSQLEESLDASLCDELSPLYEKECRIVIISQTALRSADASKCDLISEELDPEAMGNTMPDRVEQCKLDTLMQKKDVAPSDCDILKDGPQKQMCTAVLKNRTNAMQNIN